MDFLIAHLTDQIKNSQFCFNTDTSLSYFFKRERSHPLSKKQSDCPTMSRVKIWLQ
uniref:Uncharacterized protein n=1 Tax=Anguilla anguilla TaxID=7936 RepID=A0A0E9SB05_ANGAN